MLDVVPAVPQTGEQPVADARRARRRAIAVRRRGRSGEEAERYRRHDHEPPGSAMQASHQRQPYRWVDFRRGVNDRRALQDVTTLDLGWRRKRVRESDVVVSAIPCAVPGSAAGFGVPFARYSRPPSAIGSMRPKTRSRIADQSAPLNWVSIPSFADVADATATSAGIDEHLRRDASAIEAGATEHVALDDGDLPVVEVRRDRVPRSAPHDDQVERFGGLVGAHDEHPTL